MLCHPFFRIRHLLAALALGVLSALAAAEPTWQATIDSVHGMPLITRGGATGVKGNPVFWGTNWGWADLSSQFKVVGPYSYTVASKNTTLGFTMTDDIQKTADQQMVWDITLNAAADKPNVIGGGISFRFDLNTFGAEMGNPTLLPGNAGWAWGPVGGNHMEMRFDPVPAKVIFENPSTKIEVRAFFYDGKVNAGQTHYRATLTLSGRMAIAPTLGERFGLADTTTWPRDILDWRSAPVDLSFLNQNEIPAGKHGFLTVSGDQLAFQDGRTVRFWGTNITAYALFTTSRNGVKQQAHRLSQLGFNLVRLHHHDSPWVNPNIFGNNAPTTLTLSADSLDKLDWWIKCLKDEGIYVWLDMHVQRYLKPGDGIDAFEELGGGKPAELRGYNYVNTSIQRAMQDFNQAYLNHKNSYTGLRYKDDPAIVTILVTNENDLTHHFGNALLPDKKVPKHDAIYLAEAAKFASTWNLSKDLTWHSWEQGPSKLFLNDLEHRFDAAMIGDLRANGARAPVVTTSSWGQTPLSSLPALTTGDIIDSHSYGGIGEFEKSPLYAPNFIDWIAAAQVLGRPLSVSEWNVETFPVPDRHSVPLYVAASGSLQGWDAILEYAYSQAALDSAGGPSNWHAYNDPALMATLPAAALLYRQGHVRESETVYAFAPTRDQLFYQLITPANSVALRTAAERGKLVIAMPATKELPWLKASTIPQGTTVITDPQHSYLASDATSATSDTGQLQRNWEQGVYTINTPRTQAAMGWLGGRSIQLPDVGINLSTRNASVAVQTLDGRPVSTSHNLLISLGARSVPLDAGRLPFYSEPVQGRVTIRGVSGMKLYKRLSDGTEQALPVAYNNGSYVLDLDPAWRTYWLLLK